jgi:hypothetical protein
MVTTVTERTEATDYVLEVVCDHAGKASAPPRVVARTYYVPNTEGALGFIEWRETTLPDGSWPDPPALQTYWGRVRELGVDWARARASLTDRETGREMQGQRWRFHCPDCGDTLPVQQTRIVPVFETLRNHNILRITLAELRRVAL